MKIDQNTVVSLWNEHRNQHTIARILAIRQSRVSRTLRALGIHAGRGRRDPVHKLPMDLVCRLYESGQSTDQLGERFGVSPEVIRTRMASHGTRCRPSPRAGSGKTNPQWKGGNRKQEREYHKLARRVAELCLGRRLLPAEVIHHMDECEQNNRPENLWLFPSLRDHSRYHQQQLKIQCPAASKEASRLALENGGRPIPSRHDLIGSLLETGRQRPYDTRVLVENSLKACGILRGPQVQPRAHRR